MRKRVLQNAANDRSGGGGRVLTIGDLAREFGVSLRTLRFYEDRGLLSPKRVGSARLYGARDRARLALILKAKHLGFTLTEIADLLDEKGDGALGSRGLALTLAQVDTQLARLEAQIREVDQQIAKLRAVRRDLATAHAAA